MADWLSFKIEIPGKDLLEPVREILEVLLTFLEVLKAILETIKLFLIDFGNPLRALLEALIRLIEELFEALKTSGMFAYVDIPKVDNFQKFVGGYQSFLTRFKGSLYDLKDFNRPQPRAGSTKSGFVMLVVDASTLTEMIRKILFLMKFFGKAWEIPRFGPVENFKAMPSTSSGDPILRAADLFSFGEFPDAIQLQWTAPGTVEEPDPGFSDVVTKVGFEFVPPNFVIEKTTAINPAAADIGIDIDGLAEMSEEGTSGIVKFERATNFKDRTGTRVKRRAILRDSNGEPVIKFQEYIVTGAATVAFGLLGKYRYLDLDVQPGTIYYYRVRAFLGELNVNSDNVLQSLPTSVKGLTSPQAMGGSVPYFTWPATSDDNEVIMGQASPILAAAVSPDLGDFDAFAVARELFKTALSLDFHLPLREEAEFTEEGFATGVTFPTEVGRGSLLGLGDAVIPFQAIETHRRLAQTPTVNESYTALKNGPTGKAPKMPYQEARVKFTASRLAGIVVTAMMQQQEIVFQFRSLMRSSYPRGKPPTGFNLQDTSNLEEGVFAFTKEDGVNTFGLGGQVDVVGAQTFFDGYTDQIWRLNILKAINFIKSFTLGGVPPDWVSIVPLRDIIPWSAQFIYDLLDKIDALLAAFNGIIDEIRDFIDLLIRKVTALEEFIQFLIDILNFIESLQLSVFLLAATGLSGDVDSWIQALDTAGGDPPSSGPNGFSAGVCYAYVAPDVAAFEAAFTLIFGG